MLQQCQRHEHTKETKIGKPKVYIYRSTSLMLTSLCVSFQESFCGNIFLSWCCGAGAQFPDLVHLEDKMYDELLLRW